MNQMKYTIQLTMIVLTMVVILCGMLEYVDCLTK